MGYLVMTCVEFSLRENCAIVPKMPCTVWQNILLKAWVFRSSSLLARANGLAPQQRFVRFQEALSVGMLVTIAVSVFLSTFKLLSSAHTVRSWPTLKEVIERFWKDSVHEIKENVKAEPKNSKETSENNTDIEMDLLILREYFRMVFQTCSSVRAQEKCLTARPKKRNWLAWAVHEKKDLLYSIMVNFNVICVVLSINFFNSSVVFLLCEQSLFRSSAIYKENCFSIDCDQCSISLKLFLPFCFQTLAVLGNKHILFALAWFHIAHKYTKMCPLTDRLLLCFRVRYPQH